MNNIATVTCVYKNYENFYRTIYLFFFFISSLSKLFLFPSAVLYSPYSNFTFHLWLWFHNSTNIVAPNLDKWMVYNSCETRSTKAKYGPAIAGVGWIVLVSVFLFSSVNIFIRQWLQTLYVTILFFISPSSAYTPFLSSTSFSFFSTSHFRSRSRVTSFFDIVSSRRSRFERRPRSNELDT